MLHYSFSSVYMAVITSNILLILITLLFRNHKMMIHTGYKLLALFIALTILRFALPFEFSFTTPVFLEESRHLSGMISFLQHRMTVREGITISPWNMFEIIWLVGFVFNLIRYIRMRRRAGYFILANSLDVTRKEPYRSAIERICRERGKKNSFHLLTVQGLNTFMIYGIFVPHILIPENVELSEEKWYYVLSHEASHHFHHDLLIKTLTKFITMIYWWNPAGYILNKQVDVILEMRVDNIVAAYSKETITKYLHCLTELGELATRQNMIPEALTMSLMTGEGSALTNRYHMLLSVGKKKNPVINILLFLLFISIYAASHFVIFEAHYVTPEVAETSIRSTDDNTHAILKEDGTYDIYFEGYFIENTDSLEYYPEDIPIN